MVGADEWKRPASPIWLEVVLKEARNRIKAGGASSETDGQAPEAQIKTRRLDATTFTGVILQGTEPLSGTALVFTPRTSDQRSYRWCNVPLPGGASQDVELLTDAPSVAAERLELGDDNWVEVSMVGKTFDFYGVTYSSVWVHSNGFLTFGTPSGDVYGHVDLHWKRVGISALFDDLACHRPGAVVYQEMIDIDGDDRLVISFSQVPLFRDEAGNTFHITLFLDTGKIRLAWGYVASAVMDNAVVGLSAGTYSQDFEEIVVTASACSCSCGDGVRECAEACDDGNTLAGDGCSPTCTLEPGFKCTVPEPGGTDVCELAVCGDGLRDGREECDDRNNRDGDGCSAACYVEVGFTCRRTSRQHSDICISTKPAPAQIFGYNSGRAFDLAHKTLVFMPGTNSLEYTACVRSLTGRFPDEHSPRAIKLKLLDDDAVMVDLEAYVPFFGRTYRYVYVGANGVVTFESPEQGRPAGGLESHFERRRISIAYTDLVSRLGTVLYEVIEDGAFSRAVITFFDVHEFGFSGAGNAFQMAISHADGKIQMSYLDMNVNHAVVGLSPGFWPGASSLRLASGSYIRVQAADFVASGGDAIYAGDFSWEGFYKMLSFLDDPSETTILIGNYDGSLDPPAPSDNCHIVSYARIDIDWEGYVVVNLRAGCRILQGRSYEPLPFRGWAHVALVVQRGVECDFETLLHCTRVVLSINRVEHRLFYMEEDTALPLYDSGQGLFIGGSPGWDQQRPCGITRVRVYGRALGRGELGRCNYLEDVQLHGLVLNADFEGYLLDPASGIELTAVGDYSWPQDIPGDCARQEEFNMDLSHCGSCPGTCGNGVRETTESCDDGNLVAGDGCSSDCFVEHGWSCASEAHGVTRCAEVVCGDGVVEGNEECDDGNALPGDGCSHLCALEPGYTCDGNHATLNCSTLCGDGLRVGEEVCDDGNSADNDGCSGICTVEAGFQCNGGSENNPDICKPTCGDGVRMLEECDDGNVADGDGCSSSCHVEVGWACSGGNRSSTDICYEAVCGDGVAAGVEECDDFNRLPGDGCSHVCLNEPPPQILTGGGQVIVHVFPQPQACRILNADSHETLEDEIYHLQHTVLTGDVVGDLTVEVRIQVANGSMTLVPVIDGWRDLGKWDGDPESLIFRETFVSLYPFDLVTQDVTLTGNATKVDAFLRRLIYIQPQADFIGYIRVDFSMLSGVALGLDADVCEEVTLIRVKEVFNDPPQVLLTEELLAFGIGCVEGSFGCALKGVSVYDPDCEQVVDGSCYLNLSLTPSVGSFALPGKSLDPEPVLSGLVGHHNGLNEALKRILYVPPPVPYSLYDNSSVEVVVRLQRIVSRTDATPDELEPQEVDRVVFVTIEAMDTYPVLRLTSEKAFHGSVVYVHGEKPHYFDDWIFEPAGGSAAGDLTAVVITVSRGGLWLGNTEGLYFEDNTDQGQARLKFRSTGELLRTRFLNDVRYAWYDEDCQRVEQLNVSLDDGVHPERTVEGLLMLPECVGFSLTRSGSGPVKVLEDEEVLITGINLSSSDEELFLVVDIRHPHGVLGDCRVVFWPSDVTEFVEGRECHLDGTPAEVQHVLKHIMYRAPRQWHGKLQLEVVARAAMVDDAVNREGGQTTLRERRLIVDVEVEGVNGPPVIDLSQEVQILKEDAYPPVALSPIYVSDPDTDDNLLSFSLQVVGDGDPGSLYMCELQTGRVDHPSDYELDGHGCLTIGTPLLIFRTTALDFNRMQGGLGRLRFQPSIDWQGSLLVNITVDDLGSGLGVTKSRIAHRPLHLIVEPGRDPARLEFRCRHAEPLVGYGHACVEVRSCLDLSAADAAGAQGITMWATLSSSAPGVGLSFSDMAPVEVRGEGSSTIHIIGLFANVRDTLTSLIVRPPVTSFLSADDPDTFEIIISITVYTIGQLFNNPYPTDLTPFAREYDSFGVVFRRVNRAPNIFVESPAFEISQLTHVVYMHGISLLDPDTRVGDLAEVTLSIDSDCQRCYLRFAGVEGLTIVKRLPIADLNRHLEDLHFVFQDYTWFGVVGVHVEVSDLGNRGWTLATYDDFYHRDTSPQVLALRGASLRLVPANARQYHQLFAKDFTIELYVKRHDSPGQEHDVFQNFQTAAFDSNPSASVMNASDDEPACSLTLDADGRPVVTLTSEAGVIGGPGEKSLELGVWHHLAVVVRRDSNVATEGARSYHGEVALYVDGELDTAWFLGTRRLTFGPLTVGDPAAPGGAVLSLAGGAPAVSAENNSELLLSRVRLWGRALLPAELGSCADVLQRDAGGHDAAALQQPHLEVLPENLTNIEDTADAGNGDFIPFLSFGFLGTLTEAHHRATIRAIGRWSFVVDAPPKCLGFIQSPYDNVLEHCACFDFRLEPQGSAPLFWHSPQSFAGLAGAADMQPFADSHVQALQGGQGLNASTLLTIYRRFVQEPPRIFVLEPESHVLDVYEDHPGYFALEVFHKGTAAGKGRPLTLEMEVAHGALRSLTHPAVVRSNSHTRKSILYRGALADINVYLAQVEYASDPNYAGEDMLAVTVSDVEFSVDFAMPIIVNPVIDPLTLICPPAVDVLEGVQEALVGSNISIQDGDQLPGVYDAHVAITVDMFVSSGSLHMNLPDELPDGMNLTEAMETINTYPDVVGDMQPVERTGNDTHYSIATVRFNATLVELRMVLAALTFTPYPRLFYGVVHFGLSVYALASGEQASCDMGIVVHAVNSPPRILVDDSVLSNATDGGTVQPFRDLHLAGVLRILDPDEENFGDWYAQRTLSVRLRLSSSCGALSFGLLSKAHDYVFGSQRGSIAGIEGLTFHEGDGYQDAVLDVTSTIGNVNKQLHRLYYHSLACRDVDVAIDVHVDDLGNYGVGGPQRDNETLRLYVVPQ